MAGIGPDGRCLPLAQPLPGPSPQLRIPPEVQQRLTWPAPGATHLKPLRHAVGDADGELGYLGDTPFAFLAVGFIIGLGFHDHLVQETEANVWSVVRPDCGRLSRSKSPFHQEVLH